MTKQDTTTKLAATEASLKRWQTRLKRAATKVSELDRQRRRYQALLLNPDKKPPAKNMVTVTAFEVMSGISPAVADAITGKISPPPPGSMAEKYAANNQALIEASKEITLDIPAFCNRADPHVAERMTKARKEAEAEERKKMPLTGRDALKKIREKK